MNANCAVCHKPFVARSNRAQFCSSACRGKAHRSGGVQQPPPLRVVNPDDSPLPATGSVLGALIAELHAAGVLETTTGRAAVALASMVEDPTRNDPASGVAALVKQMLAVRAEALTRQVRESDPLDELAVKRAERGFRGA